VLRSAYKNNSRFEYKIVHCCCSLTGHPNGAGFVRFFTGSSAQRAIEGFHEKHQTHPYITVNIAGREFKETNNIAGQDFKETQKENLPSVQKLVEEPIVECENFIRIDGVSSIHSDSVYMELECLNAQKIEVFIARKFSGFLFQSHMQMYIFSCKFFFLGYWETQHSRYIIGGCWLRSAIGSHVCLPSAEWKDDGGRSSVRKLDLTEMSLFYAATLLMHCTYFPIL